MELQIFLYPGSGKLQLWGVVFGPGGDTTVKTGLPHFPRPYFPRPL